ncbi:MAG: dihydroneopterin aldolase [Bacteroidia bacterium]|nr:dihydroneopterin aldolase [Bacteroidia bacterium]MDW8333924.1 dihydroneopterin aldolase [Bacteroidia bacterium]
METSKLRFVIGLEKMLFYGYHGAYDEENKLGNRYEVGVEMEAWLDPGVAEDRLSSTVNYEEIYRLVARTMSEKHRLLERLAMQIAARILEAAPQVESVRVRVAKTNPPVGGVCEKAHAEYIARRE